jgi:hypothetical protein
MVEDLPMSRVETELRERVRLLEYRLVLARERATTAVSLLGDVDVGGEDGRSVARARDLTLEAVGLLNGRRLS